MAVLPCGNKYSVYQIMTMQIPQQTKKENKSDPEVLEGACAATIFTHREAMNWRAKKSITILICCLGLFSQGKSLLFYWLLCARQQTFSQRLAKLGRLTRRTVMPLTRSREFRTWPRVQSLKCLFIKARYLQF